MSPAPIEPGADDALEKRLVELETRLAFQEHAIAELSEELAQARLERARSEELLQAVLADLRGLRGALYADPASEPPPPHY
ncbi:SlyX family protein [Pseudoxanthomonas suwonensis]|uniref:SlyX family protein n=1 Tax=Pseudoxanthomonas suwonensis TaxID=314722 RepID=UPI0004B05975|nr:SlyX family protein [Pseudoxanthomonas suwonensis]